MSTRQLESSAAFETVAIQTRETHFSVPAESLHVRKNGFEFRSHTPLREWTELTLEVTSSGDGHRDEASGVVVACRGNAATGYVVSVLLLGPAEPGGRILRRAAISALA